MRRLAIAACAIAITAGTAANATPSHERGASIRSWAFAIGSGDLSGNLSARYDGYGLVVVDGEEATPQAVATLHRDGALVLAYLDVGGIEPGRSWYARARRYRLDAIPHWREWYANFDAAGYRRLIAGRVAPRIVAKGFDGLLLDDTDTVETHPRQRRGLALLARSLAALVHHRGGLLFTQNGYDVIAPLARLFDGWNREDVYSTYDFGRRRYVRQPPRAVAAARSELLRMRARGLFVTETDYLAATDSRGSAQARSGACAAGVLPFVSDIDLRRVPEPPLACPQPEPFG